MRKIILPLLFLAPLATKAQEAESNGPKINQFYVETRFGYEGMNIDGDAINDATGFKGQYLNFRIDGQIVNGLTYSYRQRLNKNTNATFFDATDWIHLDWQATKRWGISAGKQVVGIGGYEYDRAPIDLYYCSEFWNNIPCYQFGLSTNYKASDKDLLQLQLCNSPFRSWAGNNTYAFNLQWYGTHGWYESMWSVNMLEYARGKWINYIALGNRFNFNDKIHLDVDVMNRASSGQSFLFKDFSVMTELSAQVHDAVRVFGKYTYDQNKSGTDADLLVLDGTQLNLVSLGLEAAPVKNHRDMVRIFAAGAYSWGDNTNPEGTMQDKQLRLEAGIKFKADLLKGIQRIVNYKK